jgi:prepilin-type N-terminal cleavage/methylation domain-containing protein
MSRIAVRNRQRGFSLVELLISLAVLVIILVGVLQLFDLHSRIARTQTNVADMQQSLREGQNEMVRLIRMSGRGMLPAAHTALTQPVTVAERKLLPNGISVEVINDAAADATVGGNDVVEGTDVLIIRGAISSPIYLVDTVDVGNFVLTDADADDIPEEGVIKNVSSTPKADRLPVDGSELQKALTEDLTASGGDPAALVLVSPVDNGIYAVVEVDQDTSSFTGDPTAVWSADIGFKVSGGTNTAEYNKLSPKGAYPKELKTIAYVGLLDEYRFYVREETYTAAPGITELAPSLSVARYYPGTNKARPNEGSIDIADNILDLQIVLGIDLDQNGFINPEADPPDPANDEWLFNADGDTDAGGDVDPKDWDDRELYYLRINTVARTDRPDLDFVSAALDWIEDRSWGEPAVPGNDQARHDRRFRRRLMQTTIDLRNLS